VQPAMEDAKHASSVGLGRCRCRLPVHLHQKTLDMQFVKAKIQTKKESLYTYLLMAVMRSTNSSGRSKLPFKKMNSIHY